MKAAVEKNTVDRTIHIRVVDGPVVTVSEQHHLRHRFIRVDRAVIHVKDGRTSLIEVFGGIVLKTNRTSVAQRGNRSWSSDILAISPQWVQHLWRTAPVGVTEWTIDA